SFSAHPNTHSFPPRRSSDLDVFISRKAKSLRDLPHGASVGTASLRRQALVKHRRPDLAVRTLRGNVETRLRKLDAGEVDATLLRSEEHTSELQSPCNPVCRL